MKSHVHARRFSASTRRVEGGGGVLITAPAESQLGELVAQMQQHCQQQPENSFHQAALLLRSLAETYFAFAEWPRMAAGFCTDGPRHEAADHCGDLRHNAEHKPQTFWQACQLFWYMNIILQ
ncbi:hypothetical protein ACNKHM_10890 [Shigella sonnei]